MNKKKVFFFLVAGAAIYLAALFPPEGVVPSPTFGVRTDNLISEVDAGDYESRIQAALAHEGTEENPIPLDMDFLGAWELDETLSQPFPPHVLALDGRYVSIRGFMLPDVDFEHIKKFILLDHEWTTEEGELTITLKLKRKVLLEKFKELIEEMYHESVL